jgi:hypothetical protein
MPNDIFSPISWPNHVTLSRACGSYQEFLDKGFQYGCFKSLPFRQYFLMMLTAAIKKENKFKFKEVIVSVLKYLIQIK